MLKSIKSDPFDFLWRWEGEAFGTTQPKELTDIKINVRFPGQYYDQETKLHYNWHRYYDPGLGRYITSDPIGVLRDYSNLQLQLIVNLGILLKYENTNDTFNHLYNYVADNPLRYIDPLGLNRFDVCQDFDSHLKEGCKVCMFSCSSTLL